MNGQITHKTGLFVAFLVGWLLVFEAELPGQVNAAKPEPLSATENDPEIASVLASARNKNAEIPGIVAAIVKFKQPIRIAADGIRKSGEAEPITRSDKMHLGSCTKAMTATVIARLVQQQRLSWETTIGEALPELAAQIHPDYAGVTITQLLRHRSGMPANAKTWWLQNGENLSERRDLIAVASLQDPPLHEPGSKYLYSNLGYMVAGRMAAASADSTWEALIESELFQPLGITSAGFGIPGEQGKLDQPWGHKLIDGEPIPNQLDNAAALGPAGTVHMTLEDWGKFSMVHAGENSGRFLSDQSLAMLHDPGDKGDYALGWIAVDRSWANGRTLSHSGSNTSWFCSIWVAPNRQSAYLVATNISTPDIPKVLDGTVAELLRIDGALK